MLNPTSRLKKLRNYYGLSSRTMSSICHLNETNYSLYENGSEELPDQIIQRLQVKLKVNPLWLRQKQNNMFSQHLSR